MREVPWYSALVAHFPYLGLFLLLILGGIGLPFPEDATLILCGVLISVDAIRPIEAVCVVYAGVLAADLFLYWVGRKYGPAIIKHRRFRKIVSPKTLAAIKKKFDRWGILVLLVGRHLVGLRSQILLVSGVMKMPPVKFLIADGVSSLITIGLMVGAGYMGGNSLQVIRKDITKLGHLAVVLVVVGLILLLFFRHAASRRTR
ncbi:MAG TPA: DedA family protein [Thermodesulfovibrionales bacterium]|nr:DedA family protein [Thermodesulfovibrionales bacterium]